MATATQTPDLTSGMVGSQPPSPPPSTPAADPMSLSTGMVGSESEDPSKTGYLTNDVGNRVIVPLDGESFSDTVKRAIQYHKSLSPDQQQQAMQREVATMPKKTAQTLGAAAGIGVAGPAALAGVGELGGAAADALPSVLPHTIEGVKAIGAWAAKNPVQAYIAFQVLKELVPGAKKVIGIVKGFPDVE